MSNICSHTAQTSLPVSIDDRQGASDIAPGEPLDRPLRRFAATGGLTASEALEEDRAER
jgi:hypothetical protein